LDRNQQQDRVNENYGWNNEGGNQQTIPHQGQIKNMWNNGGDKKSDHQRQSIQDQDRQGHNYSAHTNGQRFANQPMVAIAVKNGTGLI